MNPLSIGKSIFVCLIKIINYLGYEKNDIHFMQDVYKRQVPTFKGFPNQYGDPFPSTLCTSVNDQVVHGIPNDIPVSYTHLIT